MPRPPRFTCPHAVHHVTLRCNNRERLSEAASFERLVWLLQETRRRSPLSLFHYCLMTNRARGRVGRLWQGRFRSTLVGRDTCSLRCMTYVDLNPVRAGIVATPAEYPWSGHAALRAEDCERLDLHPLYLSLAPDAESRYEAYMALVAEDAGREAVALAGRYFVGSRRFVGRMAKKFGLGGPGSRVAWEEHGPRVFSLRPQHGGPPEPD